MAAMIVTGFWAARRHRCDKWPEAEAKILSSEIREPLAADFDLAPSSSLDLECESSCAISWIDSSGKEHTSEYGVPEYSPLFQLYDGQTVTIRYNPSNPDEFYLREAAISHLSNRLHYAIRWIGLLGFALSLLLWAFLLFKKH